MYAFGFEELSEMLLLMSLIELLIMASYKYNKEREY